jgi:hypothetical protein
MAIGATSSSFKDFVNILILKIITSRGSEYGWGTKKDRLLLHLVEPLNLNMLLFNGKFILKV